jgi:apoptosis-inducing factor 2
MTPEHPPQPAPARVLIIGGGYAGAVCAAELAKFACVAAPASAAAATATTTPSLPPPSPPAPLLTITLVDPRDHLDAAFTHARSLVEPRVAAPSLLPFDRMRALSSVRFVRGLVVRLLEEQGGGGDGGGGGGKATLSDGSTLAFDYAVIATGSSYTFGKSSPNSGEATGRAGRLREIQAAAALFAASADAGAGADADARPPPRRVLVVGGGPLGVEVAAELLTDTTPERVSQVTLVHSSDRLLPSLPPRAGRLAQCWLSSSKPPVSGRCRLLLNRRVKRDDPLMLAADAVARGDASLPRAALDAGLRAVGGVIVLDRPGGAQAALEGGEQDGGARGPSPSSTIPYDAAIVATGIRRNTDFLAAAAATAASSSPRPRPPAPVRVDASLRAEGYKNVFAAGDCTDVKEEKLAFLAAGHGEVVAHNIVALARARRGKLLEQQLQEQQQQQQQQGQQQQQQPPPPPPPTRHPFPPPALKQWKPSQGLPVAIVTLGRAYAIMCVGPVAAAGWLPTQLKARNLLGFVQKYRQKLGCEEEDGLEGGGAGPAAREARGGGAKIESK